MTHHSISSDTDHLYSLIRVRGALNDTLMLAASQRSRVVRETEPVADGAPVSGTITARYVPATERVSARWTVPTLRATSRP